METIYLKGGSSIRLRCSSSPERLDVPTVFSFKGPKKRGQRYVYLFPSNLLILRNALQRESGVLGCFIGRIIQIIRRTGCTFPNYLYDSTTGTVGRKSREDLVTSYSPTVCTVYKKMLRETTETGVG